MLNVRHELSDDLHGEIVKMIEEDLNSVVTSRSNWISSLLDVSDNYLGVGDETRVLPWPEASDVHVPMTMISVETAHPRILSGIIGLDEMGTFTPLSSETVELSKDVTGFTNWALRTPTQVNAIPTIDRALHQSLTYGKAITKEYWDFISRETCKLFTRNRYQLGTGLLYKMIDMMGGQKLQGRLGLTRKQMEIPYAQHIKELFGNKFIRITDTTHYSDRTVLDFRYVENKELLDGRVEIPIPDNEDATIDLFIYADTTIHDAPAMHNVNIPDFLMPVETNDVDKAKFAGDRYWKTYDELMELHMDGLAYFDGDMLDRLQKHAHGENYVELQAESHPLTEVGMQEEHARMKLQAAIGDKETSDVEAGFEVIELYYSYKMPGNVRPVQWVFFFMPEFRWIYRVVRMEILCPTDRRPFVMWDFMPDDEGSFMSLGMGHIIMDLQSILNDIVNKQMDRDDLLNMPFGFFRPTSNLTKEPIRIQPGLMIPMANPNDVVIPQWGRANAADTPFIQMLMSFMERLTSATNYFQGSAPSRPNAPRTFGATAAIIQEGQVNFDLHIRRYHQSMHHVFNDTKSLYRHYRSEDIEFMAPGTDTMARVSMDYLSHDYGIIFKGNSANTNKAIRQQFNALIYDRFVGNPLIGSNPLALYNVTRRFALAHEYFEFDQDVPRPSEEITRAPMPQEQEIEAMRYGQSLAALPTDNHAEHIQVIQTFIQSDLAIEYPQEAMVLLIGHLQQHEQMMALMQRAQTTQLGQQDQRNGFGQTGNVVSIGSETSTTGASGG